MMLIVSCETFTICVIANVIDREEGCIGVTDGKALRKGYLR